MFRVNQGIIFNWLGYFLLSITFLSAVSLSFFSYEEIVWWYQGEFPNFYKNDEWTSAYFTLETYSFGQKYSWSLFIIGLIFIFLSRKIKLCKSDLSTEVSVFKIKKIEVAILIISMGSWWFWQQRAAYATDEIFSAVHFSSYPIIQTISHYPLPNNHLFFSLVNHLPSYITSDLVFSGRIISGIAISVLMIQVYRFSDTFLKNQWLKIVIVVVLLTLFPIMGFSTQARGYGLQVLFGAIAFFNIYKYDINRRQDHLIYYVISSVLGFWTLPSFLYYWVGISASFFVKMLLEKKLDFPFIKAGFLTVWAVLVVYLPVVILSGWQSLLRNKYVAPEAVSHSKFAGNLLSGDYFKGLFNEWFYTGEHTLFGLIIFLIPIVIGIFYQKKPTSKILWYIVSIAVSFLLITIFMKKYPFYRNLLSHCLLFWLISLLFISGLIETCFKKGLIIWLIVLVSLSSLFVYMNFDRYPYLLYYYDVNGWNRPLHEKPMDVFSNKNVFIEDESFYWYFPVNQVTENITLGGIINNDCDFVIIESQRQSKIDTTLWQQHSHILESRVWMRRR